MTRLHVSLDITHHTLNTRHEFKLLVYTYLQRIVHLRRTENDGQPETTIGTDYRRPCSDASRSVYTFAYLEIQLPGASDLVPAAIIPRRCISRQVMRLSQVMH